MTVICYTLITFRLPRWSKSCQELWKKTKTSLLMFVDWQITAKDLPFGIHFGLHLRLISVCFWSFGPRRDQHPPSDKKERKQEPQGCHKLPRRSQKGATMMRGDDLLVKDALFLQLFPHGVPRPNPTPIPWHPFPSHPIPPIPAFWIWKPTLPSTIASNTIQWQIIQYKGKPKGRRHEASAREIYKAETWH